MGVLGGGEPRALQMWHSFICQCCCSGTKLCSFCSASNTFRNAFVHRGEPLIILMTFPEILRSLGKFFSVVCRLSSSFFDSIWFSFV